MTSTNMGGGSESKKQLGKILLQQKLVSADSLQEMLEEQKRDPGSRLASAGARTGRFSMADALRALSEQYGVASVDLTEQIVPLGTLRLIPVEIARERSVFPFRLEGEQLLLAMSSPDERELIDELEFVTAKKIQPFVALYEVTRRVIEYAYAALDRGEEYYVGAHVEDLQLAALGLPDLPRAPEPLSAYPPSGIVPDPASIPHPLPVQAAPLPVERAAAAAPAPIAQVATDPFAGPALDAAFAQRSHASTAPEPRALDTGASALLAVHDSETRVALSRMLYDQGVVVLEADDGQSVLDLLQAETPRVLVVGTFLAKVGGLEICRRLRASERHAALPIIVLCDAFGGWRMALDLSLGLGIKHFFDLPCDAGDLAQTVRLLLEGQAVPEEPPPLSAGAAVKWNSSMEAFERGDLDAAIAQLEAAAVVEPRAFELQYHLGLLYGRREELFAAIRALEIAVSLHTRHFAAIKNLAVVYQRVGFRHKALDAWQRAAVAAPDDETRTNIKQHMISLL